MTDPISPALKLEMARVMAAEQKRQDDIARSWKYYDGDAPKPLKPLVLRNGKVIDDNAQVNFSRLLVDTSVHYLFGQPLGLNYPQIGEGADAKDDPLGEWIGEALPMRKRMMLLQKLATNGGIGGHTMGRILLPEPGEKYPRTIVLDPSMVTARWDPTDIDRVVRWEVNFVALDPATQKPRQYRTIITPNGEPTRPSSWSIEDFEGEPGTTLAPTGETGWPYTFSPIIHCQNLPRANEFYGAPDLESDILDLQSAIDRVLSMGNKVVRTDTKPPTFIKGMTAPQIAAFSNDPDAMNSLPSAEAEIIMLESNAELDKLILFKNELVDHLREVAHLPEAASGKVSGALSSLTLRMLLGPILAMTEAKHNTYGEMVSDLAKRLAVIGGFASKYDDALTPDLHWESVVPADEATEILRDQADLDIGFSKDTLIERRGGDPDTEREKREQDQVNVGDALLGDPAALRNFERGAES